MRIHCPAAIACVLLLAGCALPPQPPEPAVPSSPPATVSPPSAPPSTEAIVPTFPTTIPLPPAAPPADTDFVLVRDYIPDIVVALPYATTENFTGQVIYDFSDAWLRYGTVKKLMLVQDALAGQGLHLKIWDAFRPTAAQLKLWDVFPDPTYVSDPAKGFTSHCRGNTVDITLVDSSGTELTMPTGFDCFSPLADRDYSDCTEEAAKNALFLETLLKQFGFKPYFGEWWHFTDCDTYPVDEVFIPS